MKRISQKCRDKDRRLDNFINNTPPDTDNENKNIMKLSD